MMRCVFFEPLDFESTSASLATHVSDPVHTTRKLLWWTTHQTKHNGTAQANYFGRFSYQRRGCNNQYQLMLFTVSQHYSLADKTKMRKN